MPTVTSSLPKWYDAAGNRIEGITVTGTIHKQVLAKIHQKAKSKDFADIHRYIEGVIDAKLN